MLAQPRVKRLLSSEHFSVDGTLIEAWASMKSFKPKDAPDWRGRRAAAAGATPTADFQGEKRSNETHASTTDPDARLYRKGPGKEAKLCFIGHGLMENRHGLIVDAWLTRADGHAERVAALRHDRASRRSAAGDHARRRQGLRRRRLRQRAARDERDARMSRRTPAAGARRSTAARPAIAGYAVSQRIRKRIEEAFGWIKTVAGLRKTRFRGLRPGRTGPSPSRPPPTIWCGCPSCSRRRRREQRRWTAS